MSLSPITVLLVDDHEPVRESLRALLELEPDIKVLGEADNGHRAVALTHSLCPDVVIMDISMPLLDGLEATRQILNHTASAKVLVLSAHHDEAYVQHAKGLGASGFLVKSKVSGALAIAVRAVHSGTSFFSPCTAPKYQHS